MNTVDKHALPVGRLRAWGHTEGTLSLSPVFEPGLCDINSCVFKTNCYSVCAQSCPTLCDPLDCSPPGFSVHGISQARLLEWVAISFSRRSSQPGIKPMSPESPALQKDSLPLSHLGSCFLL